MSFKQTKILERKYQKRVEKLFQALFSSLKSAKTLEEVLKKVQELPKGFQDEGARWAAGSMVAEQNNNNKRKWRGLLGQSPRGRKPMEQLQKESLEETIENIINENVKLIKSIPQDLADRTVHKINQWQKVGLRPEEMARRLKEEPPKPYPKSNTAYHSHGNKQMPINLKRIIRKLRSKYLHVGHRATCTVDFESSSIPITASMQNN